MNFTPSSIQMDILRVTTALGFFTKSKVTFGVKIHRLLEYIKQHPEDAAVVGLIWSTQPGIFLANTKSLTIFLGLKVNSVNTNFREHGFIQIKNSPMTSPKLIELTGVSLPDEHHGKKLKQVLLTYSRSSDECIAAKIDIEVRPKLLAQKFHHLEGQNPDESHSESVPAVLQTISLFFSDSMKTELENVITKLHPKFEVRHRILSLALSQWMARIGQIESVAVQIFLDAFLPRNDHSKMSLKQTNCRFLLDFCTSHSRFVQNHVSFTDFFRLFLRYGSSNGLHQTFDSITPSESRFGGPCFCDGFCFGWNIATIKNLLCPGDWAVVEGDQPSTFSFITNTILIIRVDPSDDLHHFTFNTPNGEQHSAASWNELFRLIDVQLQNGLCVHVPASSGSFPRASSKWEQPIAFDDLNNPLSSLNSENWNCRDF
jgi:hypothetical protein